MLQIITPPCTPAFTLPDGSEPVKQPVFAAGEFLEVHLMPHVAATQHVPCKSCCVCIQVAHIIVTGLHWGGPLPMPDQEAATHPPSAFWNLGVCMTQVLHASIVMTCL